MNARGRVRLCVLIGVVGFVGCSKRSGSADAGAVQAGHGGGQGAAGAAGSVGAAGTSGAGGMSVGGASGASGSAGAGGKGGAGGSSGGVSGAGGGASGGAGGAGGGSGAGGSGGSGGAGGATSRVCGFRAPPDHRAAGSSRFDTSSDSVVVDEITGLSWQRTLSRNGVAEPCRSNTVDCMNNVGNATGYCASLTLGGTSGWRVPSVLELTSIVDFQTDGPTIDRDAFPGTPADYFWTSTGFFIDGPSPRTPIAFWSVEFDKGTSTNGNPNFTGPVRCVKAPADPPCTAPGERFMPGASGPVATITDRITGLVWQQGTSPQAMPWDQAAAHCQSVGAGFRVPGANELLSLVDFSIQHAVPIDMTAFPGTPKEIFWTSTSAAGTPAMAVAITFDAYGSVQRRAANGAGYVRCVR